MITYQFVEETLTKPELGTYTAFAIRAYEEKDGKQMIHSHISDVFLNKKEAEHFVELCNRLQLDIVHLPDVIEDALAGAFSN